MLTVKHQDTDGTEVIFSVYEAKYSPNGPGSTESAGATPNNGYVRFTYPMRPNVHAEDKGILESVYRGKVYIMNDVGKTVAKYDLGGWPVVHAGGGGGGGGVTWTGLTQQGANVYSGSVIHR